MDFLSFGLNQTCTYWARTGVDGFNQPSFAAPVELMCRWEDRTEKIQNDDGEEVLSRAKIFLGQDVSVGDYLALGSVESANPRQVASAYRIIAFMKIPGLYAETFERKAFL